MRTHRVKSALLTCLAHPTGLSGQTDSGKRAKPAWIKASQLVDLVKLYMFIRGRSSIYNKLTKGFALDTRSHPAAGFAKQCSGPDFKREIVQTEEGSVVVWVTLYSGLSTPLRPRGEASPLPLAVDLLTGC